MQDLVAIVDALAGMDMGLLPVTAQLPSSSSSSSSRRGAERAKRLAKVPGAVATCAEQGGGSEPCGKAAPAMPVLQLQQRLLSLLQPKLRMLQLTQVAGHAGLSCAVCGVQRSYPIHSPLPRLFPGAATPV